MARAAGFLELARQARAAASSQAGLTRKCWHGTRASGYRVLSGADDWIRHRIRERILHQTSPDMSPDYTSPDGRRILVLGSTGTVGRAAVRALLRRGHDLVCVVRRRHPDAVDGPSDPRRGLPPEVEVREADLTDPTSAAREVFRGEYFDAVVSCMASRTGAPADAWAVEYDAHVNVLAGARQAGVAHFVLLSAICVQKPRLEFQRAKLAFEDLLMGSGLTWSIVRATAFFKSISGQVERVRDGKPFLVFGDGTLNACKPIGENDLAEFLAGCLEEPSRWNRILPVGGPGPALTPREQGELLFRLAGAEPRFRRVPVGLLRTAAAVLAGLARVFPPARDRAELARIGLYYATESMLVWDDEQECYDAAATPGFGQERLEDYYRKLLSGEIRDERGEHAIF